MELESLRRQVRLLSGEVARVERERDKRLSDKDSLIVKKNTRSEKTEKAFAKLKKDHYELNTTARILRNEAQANVHHTTQLQNEIKVICEESDAIKWRTKANAKLLLKIKMLRLKYHAAHGTATLSSTEVMRDLVDFPIER